METSGNPVVDLCLQGMTAEATSGAASALALYRQAWDRRSDDFEACVAAHFVARQQPTLDLTLHWNRLALRHAEASEDERVRAFHASLHLNLGKCHEDLGELDHAGEHYALARRSLDRLEGDGYGDMMRRGVAAGLERVGR